MQRQTMKARIESESGFNQDIEAYRLICALRKNIETKSGLPGYVVIHKAFRNFLELIAWDDIDTISDLASIPLSELHATIPLMQKRHFLKENPRLGKLGGRNSRVQQILFELRDSWSQGYWAFIDKCYSLESQYARSTIYEALKKL
jgi:hypothetical protein